MIVVLSLNTAIDRVLLVPHFEAGRVFRAQEVRPYAGGKGLNVVRALRRLDVPVRVVGFLGGAPKEFIQGACTAMGIDQHWIVTAGDSRTCAIIVDPESHEQTVVNEPGPSVGEADLARLRATLRRATEAGDILCISGSAPPGAGDDLYAEIVRDMHARDVRVLADVSGRVLRLTLGARPWAVAPNLEESVAAFAPEGERALDGAAAEMVERLTEYSEHALLTLGREGVLYASAGSAAPARWRLRPPEVRTINAVASGDAFVAGFLAGIAEGSPPLEAARLGVACGASNAGRLQPDVGSRQEVEALAARVEILPL